MMSSMMPLRGLTFNAIDVETANGNPASICQIGVVCVRDGRVEEQLSIPVDPEEHFNPGNVRLHGIDAEAVRGSDTFAPVYKSLCRLLAGTTLVSHTGFDRVAIERAAEKYSLEPMDVTWLDSSRVARRAWPDRYRSRWSLARVTSDLGIEFKHHDAAEDARAAAEIILHAARHTGLDIDGWVDRVGT